MHKHLQRLTLSSAFLASILSANMAWALPENGTVVSGTANINISNQQMAINQTSNSAVINWHGFDTAANESVLFNQPNANSTVLNRITSGLPTNFAGSLTANGKVFIVNPAGLVFAGSSNINAASFIATTMDIQNDDFMQGKYKFYFKPGHEYSAIINNGKITAADYGVVALIAPYAVNNKTGVITANYGRVELASGKAFVLDFNQDNLINFDASSVLKAGYVDNAGNITANSGYVYLTANAVSKVLDNTVSAKNIDEATTVIRDANGNVILNGSINNSGDIRGSYIYFNAHSDINLGGEVRSDAFFEGDINANSQHGNIILSGEVWSDPGYELNAPNGSVIRLDSSRTHAGFFYSVDHIGNSPVIVGPQFGYGGPY